MPSYYVGDLSSHVENDDALFLERRLPCSGPVTVDGVDEFKLNSVVDARRRVRGWQFLVAWSGWGLEDQSWLLYSALKKCKILEDWVRSGGDGLKELLDSVVHDTNSTGIIASLFGFAGTSTVSHVFSMNDQWNLGGLGIFIH